MEKHYVTRYTVKQICDELDLEVPESAKSFENEPLVNMACNPKWMRAGGALFYRGKSNDDAHEVFQRAIKCGVRFIITIPKRAKDPLLEEIPHVFFDSSFRATQIISGNIRRRLGMKVVGVTGSIGKTSTKDVIFSVLSQGHNASCSLGNQNTIFPIFDNMQRLSPETEFYVQEFGIKKRDVMPNTVNACVPDAAVLTNIQEPHLEVFGTKENILAEKLRMAQKMPAGCPVFLNYDDELLRTVELEEYPIISFAVENPEAEYRAENIVDYGSSINFDIVHGSKRVPAALNVPGLHNVGNAVVAYAIGEYFGIPEKDIIKGIAEYGAQGIRQNIVNIGGYTVYLDCYNTAPTSLLGALDVLAKLPLGKGGRRLAVMSDIPRMGDEEAAIHAEVGKAIGEKELDIAYCFGDDNARIMADAINAAGGKAYYTSCRDELDAWVRDEITREDVILFKGSVPRLLSKSVDQIFGTAYHAGSEHFDTETYKGFRMKVIYETANPEAKTVAVARYLGPKKTVTVPDSFQELDVFAVGVNAFFDNRKIVDVTIPAPIRTVAAQAFLCCTKLRRVTLPETLKVIGADAFSCCPSLREVVIPEGVIEIGDEAFAGCPRLRKVVIPASVAHIGKNAFAACPFAKIEYAKTPYLTEFFKTNKNDYRELIKRAREALNKR